MQREALPQLQSGNARLPPGRPPRPGRSLQQLKLGHAVRTPEVLATVAATVLVAVFLWLYADDVDLPGWSAIAATGFGVCAAIGLAVVAMEDPQVSEFAVMQDLGDKLRVEELRDSEIKRLVRQVISHRAHMERQRFGRDGKIDGIEVTLRAIDHWISGISRLVLVVEPALIESRSHSVQKLHLISRIEELEARIATSSNRMTAEQLRETMAARRMQFRSIEELENQTERGLLRLEHAVSALGAMDAKLAMLGACDDGQSELKLSTPDITSEIAEIDAVIAAMQRVYAVFPQETNQDA